MTRRPGGILVTCLAAVALGAVPAGAQERAPGATVRVALPRWDVAGTVGWFNARHRANGSDRWLNRSTIGTLAAGHYWTEHAKTEVDVGGCSETRMYVFPENPGVGGYYWSEQYFKNLKISVGQIYQFGHNAWVHPFVGGGIDVDRERVRTVRPAQRVPADWSDPYGAFVDIPALDATAASWRARAFGLAGVKSYVSRRAFFRADVRFSAGRTLDQVTFRAGFGADF